MDSQAAHVFDCNICQKLKRCKSEDNPTSKIRCFLFEDEITIRLPHIGEHGERLEGQATRILDKDDTLDLINEMSLLYPGEPIISPYKGAPGGVIGHIGLFTLAGTLPVLHIEGICPLSLLDVTQRELVELEGDCETYHCLPWELPHFGNRNRMHTMEAFRIIRHAKDHFERDKSDHDRAKLEAGPKK